MLFEPVERSFFALHPSLPPWPLLLTVLGSWTAGCSGQQLPSPSHSSSWGVPIRGFIFIKYFWIITLSLSGKWMQRFMRDKSWHKASYCITKHAWVVTHEVGSQVKKEHLLYRVVSVTIGINITCLILVYTLFKHPLSFKQVQLSYHVNWSW